MTTKKTPGARGTIWSEGIHHVWVNGKPARVRVPQYTIQDTYQQFQDEIQRNGGIPIGIDHIPDDLLEQYPILNKLDPQNVGRITEVKSDGNRIYATKSEHTNSEIAELYSKGELTDYSVVARMFADIDEADDADYVFNNFKRIKRMDYVDEGGCTACKVGSVPDDLILTAKLSMEVDKLTDEPKKKDEPIVDDPKLDNPKNDDEPKKDDPKIDDPKVDEPVDDPVEPVEPVYVTQEAFDTAIGELKTLITSEPTEIEARLAEMELRATKAEIKAKVDLKVQEGKIKPAQVTGLIEAGLAMKPEDFDKHLGTYTETVVDLEQHSIHANNSNQDDKDPKTLNMDDMRAARNKGRF